MSPGHDTVHAVLPDGVDDLARPSGGNVYDRRILRGLAALGRRVVEQPVTGAWPTPGAADLERLEAQTVTGDLHAKFDRSFGVGRPLPDEAAGPA